MRVRKISTGPFLVLTVSMLFGICLGARNAGASPVIAAYQEIYRMNFEVFHQPGLPAGWFATADGYLVAQISSNHWVYGNAPQQGTLVPTETAVGSVVPMSVPQLARLETPLWGGGVYETMAFRAIPMSRLDNMGVLDDPFVYTPIAWKNGESWLWIWMGDKWWRMDPMGGQSTAQAFRAWHAYIAKTLREKRRYWTETDTIALEDLAREWGLIWRGDVYLASLREYNDSGSDETRSTGGGGSPGGSGNGGTNNGGNGDNWDD